MSEPGQMRQLVRLLDARELEARVRDWSKLLTELLPLRARLYHLALTLFAAIIPAGTGDPEAIFGEFANTTFPDGRYLAPMAYGGAVRFAAGTPSADVLRMALAAGYEGVEAPRRFGRYKPVSEEQRRRSATIVTELQVALCTGEGLRLVYQPRLHAQTLQCTSVEALLRWQHATLGRISPGEFIPLAQQAALSRALTDRVIDLAVADFEVWGGAKGPGRISLNIFPTDLRDPDFHTRLLRNLKAHGVAPAAVELELTELSRVDSEDVTTTRSWTR